MHLGHNLKKSHELEANVTASNSRTVHVLGCTGMHCAVGKTYLLRSTLQVLLEPAE